MNIYVIDPGWYDGDVDEMISASFTSNASSLKAANVNTLKYLKYITRMYDWAKYEDGYLAMSDLKERLETFRSDVDHFVFMALELGEGLSRDDAKSFYTGTREDFFDSGYKPDGFHGTLNELISGYREGVTCEKTITNHFLDREPETRTEVAPYTIHELALSSAASLYDGIREKVFRLSVEANFQDFMAVFPKRAFLHSPKILAALMKDPNYQISHEERMKHFRENRALSMGILTSMSTLEVRQLVPDPSDQMLVTAGRYQTLRTVYDMAAETGQVPPSELTPEVMLNLKPGDAEGDLNR